MVLHVVLHIMTPGNVRLFTNADGFLSFPLCPIGGFRGGGRGGHPPYFCRLRYFTLKILVQLNIRPWILVPDRKRLIWHSDFHFFLRLRMAWFSTFLEFSGKLFFFLENQGNLRHLKKKEFLNGGWVGCRGVRNPMLVFA